jgi:hypothetical protein
MSHKSVAKSVREAKEKNPENFCSKKGCLWRTRTRQGYRPCERHELKIKLVDKCGIDLA